MVDKLALGFFPGSHLPTNAPYSFFTPLVFCRVTELIYDLTSSGYRSDVSNPQTYLRIMLTGY